MDSESSPMEEIHSNPDLGEGTQSAPSDYTKFQSLKYGHKTSDPTYSDDWGDLKRFILFPNHLPDLHIPTADSMGEVVDSLELSMAGRWLVRTREKNVPYLIAGIVILFLAIWFAVNVGFYMLYELISKFEFFEKYLSETRSVVGVSSFGVVAAIVGKAIYEYNTSTRKWKNHTPPLWKKKNNQRLKDWHTSHLDFLRKRNVNKNLRKMMGHVIERYSKETKKMHWSNGDRDQFTTPIELTDVVGDSSHYDAEMAIKDEDIAFYEAFLNDAINKLEPNERETYYIFNGVASSEIPRVLPPTINQSYLTELTEQLHKRTKRISSNDVIEKWIDLLDQPDFDARTISTEDKNTEITIQELIDLISPTSDKGSQLIAIKGNSGLGKTTLMTQLCIHFLKSEQTTTLPLFIRAREIKNIDIDGSIGLKTLSKSKPYISEWLDSSEHKLLIVDGIDENMNMNQKLLDNLHKTANLHKSHVICTGRMNVEPSDYFTTYHLSDFTEDYLHQMIRRSSDNPHNRVMLNRYLPDKLKQHPLVLFGSADILTTNDGDFESANLSFHALADLIFQRDVIESKKKYGISKPQVNLLNTIGEFALQKIIDSNHPVPENNQVFEVAEKWELIDENGVNETLLEGFFIMHSIEDSQSSSDNFIDAWEKLYDVDIERWTNYAQAYLTSPNERLPSMSDYYFNNDDEVEFIRLVAIAEQEWRRSNTEGRKRIIQRLGFSPSSQGRIRIDEKYDFKQFEVSSNLIEVLLWFHNRTWMDDYNEWSRLDSDPTWERLANEFLMLECPEIITRMKQQLAYFEYYNSSTEARDTLPPWYRPSRFIEILNPRKIFWRNGTEPYNSFLIPSIKRPRAILLPAVFRNHMLLPIDNMLPLRNRSVNSLPQPLMNFLNSQFDELSTMSEEGQERKLLLLFIFLCAACNGSNSSSLFSIKESIDFVLSIDEVFENLHDEAKIIFRQIYALLRGDSSPRKDRILNPSKPRKHQWSEVKFTFPDAIEDDSREIIYLNKSSVKLETTNCINKNEGENNYHLLISQNKENMPIIHTGSYSGQQNMNFYPCTFARDSRGSIHADFTKSSFIDNIERRTRLSNERIYSPIPLKLLVGENIYCLINTNPNNSSGFEHEWGFLPWLKDMPSKLTDLIYDNETINRYSSLDDLNMKLKTYGKVSSEQEAYRFCDELGVDTTSKFIGVCDLNNRTNNHFYIHILGGALRNDIYVTEEAKGNTWHILEKLSIDSKILQEDNSKFQTRNIVFVEFEVKFEQLKSNKHCIIVPDKLKPVCRSCLESKANMSKDYPTMCMDCYSEIRGCDKYIETMSKHLGYILPGTRVSASTEVVKVSSDCIEFKQTVEDVMKFYLPVEDIKNWKIEFYNDFEFYGQERVEIEKHIVSIWPHLTKYIDSVFVSNDRIAVLVNDDYHIGQFVGLGGDLINKFKKLINQTKILVFHVNYTGINKRILFETLLDVYEDRIRYIERIELTSFDSLLEIFTQQDMAGLIIGAQGRDVKELEQRLNQNNFQVRCVVGINE